VRPGDPITLQNGKVYNRLKGYRKAIRPSWYRVFDAVRVLDEMCSMRTISSSTFQEFEDIYESDVLPRPVDEYDSWLPFSIYMASLSECMTTILYFRFADIMWEHICLKSRNGNMKRSMMRK